MPDARLPFHHRNNSLDDRFMTWVDGLVDSQRSDAPAPDSDFADVAQTATTVHRTVGIGSATTLPTERTEAMWEELMNTATMNPVLSPTSPNGGAAPLPASSGRALIAPRPGWHSYLLTAALIVAIMLASIATIWRIADPLNGDDPGTANQPGFLASATPADESPDGCPLTSDMPIFVGEPPSFDSADSFSPTMAVVQPDGDFVLTCDGVENPEPLMSGVTDVMTLDWPGTVLLELEGDTAIGYNSSSAERVELGDFDLASSPGLQSDPSSPWLVTPNNAAYTDWRITNLQTMESMVLSDEIDGVLPRAWSPEMTWSPGSPIGIFANTGDYLPTDLPDNAEDATIAELPADALVVDETFQTRRWIDTWGEIAVSTDGEAIAYQESDPVEPLKVEDARTGEVIIEFTEFNINNRAPSRFAFSGDGESLVFINGNDVWLATYGDDPTTTLLDTGDIRPAEVRATGVPGRVLINHIPDAPVRGIISYPSNPTPVSIINTETGEVTDLDGIHVPPSIFVADPWAHLDSIVTMSPSPQFDAMTVFQLVDIATGEVILSSEPVDISIQTIAEDFILPASTPDGAITIMRVPGASSVYINATTQTVAPIDVEWQEQPGNSVWIIAPSSDGQLFFAFGAEVQPDLGTATPFPGDFFAVAQISDDPEWSVSVDTLPAGFIRGIAPQVGDDPAVLEAQDVTPLEASPVATPANASSSTGCDLSGDIPVVTSADVLPWEGTVMVLSDGTLTLQCGEHQETIAEGVEGIVPTFWPGSMLLRLESGSLHGINLITGADSELVPPLGLAIMPPQEAPNPGSPWMLLPTGEEPGDQDWLVVDLRTMESLRLSEAFGDEFDNVVPVLTTNGEDAAFITNPAASPQEVRTLVIAGSVDNWQWIDGAPPFSVSPDGTLLAYFARTDTGTSLRVERLTDGELVANTVIEYGSEHDVAVLNDGAGLLHLAEGRLDLVTWNPGLSTETFMEFEPNMGGWALTLTADPDVVVVSEMSPAGGGYLVNTATGEITEVPHLLRTSLIASFYSDGTLPRHVLAASPVGDAGNQATIQMIDVTTGEVVVESDPVAGDPARVAFPTHLTLEPSMLRAHGTIGVSVYRPGQAIVLNAATGESFEIDAPADLAGVSEDQEWFFYPSIDGTSITAVPVPELQGGGPLFARELVPDAEWVEVSPDSLVASIVGSQALPGPGDR